MEATWFESTSLRCPRCRELGALPHLASTFFEQSAFVLRSDCVQTPWLVLPASLFQHSNFGVYPPFCSFVAAGLRACRIVRIVTRPPSPATRHVTRPSPTVAPPIRRAAEPASHSLHLSTFSPIDTPMHPQACPTDNPVLDCSS